MRRGRLAGLVAVAALTATPALAQEPDAPLRAADSATVRGRETTAAPGRLRLFLDDTVLSPTLAPRLAFSAALDHRDGAQRAWGTGADAYAKRMAARAGLVMSQAAVQHGTAALLGLDPRGDQSRCGCTNPLRRATHALTRTLYTRDRRGRAVPNVPLVAGAAGGAMIAKAWYPRDERPGPDAARFAMMAVVGQAGANVFKEFAPELKRLMPRRKRSPHNEPMRNELARAEPRLSQP
ncbi:MAG: hypothetical protein ABIT71_06760 [Vicinamibacteraceae bacterium]